MTLTELVRAEGATVCNLEMLKTSGEINHGQIFSRGTTIEIPESPTEDDFQSIPVKNSSFRANQVRALVDSKPQWLFIGSLRRQPLDAEESLKPYKVNYDLYKSANDYERVMMCAGRTLTVIDVPELDFPRRNKGEIVYDEHNRVAARKARLPIFELK